MLGTNQEGVLSQIWRIYVRPHTVFWSLPALFLIFVSMILLDGRAVCSTPRRWVEWMVFACAMVGAESLLSELFYHVFGIWGAMVLMPYFLLGGGFNDFPIGLRSD